MNGEIKSCLGVSQTVCIHLEVGIVHKLIVPVAVLKCWIGMFV